MYSQHILSHPPSKARGDVDGDRPLAAGARLRLLLHLYHSGGDRYSRADVFVPVLDPANLTAGGFRELTVLFLDVFVSSATLEIDAQEKVCFRSAHIYLQ